MDTGVLLDEVAKLDIEPWRLDDAAMATLIPDLTTAIHRLQAIRVRLVAAVDERPISAMDGYTNAAAWMASTTVLNDRQARQVLRTARALTHHDEVRSAYDAGDICDEHATLVASFLERPPNSMPAEALPAARDFLIEAAKDRDTRVVRSHVNRLEHLFESENLPPAEDTERNTLYATPTLNGRVIIKGDVDAETGDMLLTALSPLSKPRPESDAEPDRRSPGQRRADAFTEVLRRYHDAAAGPTEGNERPHLNVSIDAKDLAAAAPNGEIGTYDEAFERTGIGWMSWMGPLSKRASRRLACDSIVALDVLDHNGVPIDLGRTTRVVSHKLRRALVARDHGCAFPECGRPSSWCDAHHIHHWADGGPTDMNNLVLLCRFHHRLVHHSRWKVKMGDDHRPGFVPPGTGVRTPSLAPDAPLRGPRRRAAT